MNIKRYAGTEKLRHCSGFLILFSLFPSLTPFNLFLPDPCSMKTGYSLNSLSRRQDILRHVRKALFEASKITGITQALWVVLFSAWNFHNPPNALILSYQG